jgi:hypothetical protein
MLSPECHDSPQTSPTRHQLPAHTVTISVSVGAGKSAAVTEFKHRSLQPIKTPRDQGVNLAGMAGETILLECPMCDFTVLPTDDYVLQLHFEQNHTTDSPFKIEDDADPPLPAPSERKHVQKTPSDNSEEEEDTVTCPQPDCGEVVLLSDFNDHLDFHTAESLSFDETTKKYHSHHSSATMHNLVANRPHTRRARMPTTTLLLMCQRH